MLFHAKSTKTIKLLKALRDRSPILSTFQKLLSTLNLFTHEFSSSVRRALSSWSNRWPPLTRIASLSRSHLVRISLPKASIAILAALSCLDALILPLSPDAPCSNPLILNLPSQHPDDRCFHLRGWLRSGIHLG